MSFYENLRAARERRGYTQQQVADLMGLDKSTYCGYETGKRQPDVSKLKKLSKILGVSGDELLETGFEKETTPVSEGGQCANIIKIAGRDGSFIEKRLTDDQVSAMKALIETFPEAPDEL